MAKCGCSVGLVFYQAIHDWFCVADAVFGALVRSVVPEAREDELIRYRTINNQGVEASRNLRDTIVTMRNRQN